MSNKEKCNQIWKKAKISEAWNKTSNAITFFYLALQNVPWRYAYIK